MVQNDLTPGLQAFMMQKHPQVSPWPSRDYQAYKSLCQQTKVRSHPNPEGATRPHATWKYKHMLRKMVVPGEKIVEEESEESEDTDTASIGNIGESSDSSILSPPLPTHTRKSWSELLPPAIPPPSPTNTRFEKARKTKVKGAFYEGYKGEGVVYLPGGINGLAKKLKLLAAEFFAGHTTVRNELLHVLDALLRLKQLTRKEYTNITARLAA